MGYSMVLIKNLKFLHLDFYRPNWSKKVFSDILNWMIAFVDNKIFDIRKLQNLHFSKGVSLWCCSQIWNFFILAFFCQIISKNVLGSILDRKEPFPAYKDIHITKLQNMHCIFPKGLVHGFGPKFEISSAWLSFRPNLSKKCLTTFLIER